MVLPFSFVHLLFPWYFGDEFPVTVHVRFSRRAVVCLLLSATRVDGPELRVGFPAFCHF